MVKSKQDQCKDAAEDLLKYLGGDENVWDGYHVAEVAEILEPLARFYIKSLKPKAKKMKKSKAQELAEKLTEVFIKNKQFEG